MLRFYVAMHLDAGDKLGTLEKVSFNDAGNIREGQRGSFTTSIPVSNQITFLTDIC